MCFDSDPLETRSKELEATHGPGGYTGPVVSLLMTACSRSVVDLTHRVLRLSQCEPSPAEDESCWIRSAFENDSVLR